MEQAEMILVAFFFLLVGVIYSLVRGFFVIFSGFKRGRR